jgi:hypothetical protein
MFTVHSDWNGMEKRKRMSDISMIIIAWHVIY